MAMTPDQLELLQTLQANNGGQGQASPAKGSPAQPMNSPSSPQKEEGLFSVGDTLTGLAGGVRDATQNTADFAYGIADWIDNQTGANILPDKNPLQLPNWEQDTTIGHMSRGVANALAGFIGAGKLMKAAGLLQGAGTALGIGRALTAGVATDAIAMDPNAERLSNLVEQFPALQNPVTEYLAHKDGDTEAEGRFKNAVEGLGLGGLTEGLFHMVGALRVAGKAGTKAAADEALVKGAEAADNSVKALKGESVDPMASELELTKQTQLARKAEAVKTGQPLYGVEDLEGFKEAQKAVVEGKAEPDPNAMFNRAFNTAKLDTGTEELVTLSNVADSMDKTAIQKISQTQSFAETGAKALEANSDITGIPQDTLLSVLGKHAADGDKLAGLFIAAKQRLVWYGEQIKDAAAKVLSSGGPKEEAVLVKLMAQSSELMNTLKGVQANSARVMAFSKMEIQGAMPSWAAIEAGTAEEVSGAMQALGGDSQSVRDLATKLLAAGGDPKATMMLVNAGWQGKVAAVAKEYWINSILSNPVGRMVDFLTGVGKTVAMPAERIAGGLLTMNMEQVQHGIQTYVGLARCVKDAIGYAAKTSILPEASNLLDPHHGVQDIGKVMAISAENLGLTDSFLGSAVDWMGRVLRLPQRTMTTADEFLKQLNYRADLYARLYTEGAGKGLKDEALAQYISGNFNKFFDVTMRQGFDGQMKNIGMATGTADMPIQYARAVTFQQDLEKGLSKDIQTLVAKHPALQFIIPFVRTPINLVTDLVEHTPGLQYLYKSFREDLAAGGERAAMARGKQATGAMLYLGAGMAVHEGVLTGGGPKDKAVRERLEATGWQPYSVKIGDKYYSYQRFDPFGMVLGLAADYAEISGQMDGKESQDVALLMTMALMKNITSKTYLKGISDMIHALDDPERSGAKWAGGFIASWLPFSSGMGLVRRMEDPEMREVRTVMDNIRNRIPGYSATLPAKRDWVTGQAVHYPASLGPDVISPIALSQDKNDTVMNELARLGHRWELGDSVGGVKLDSTQHSRLAELHGTSRIGRYTLKERLQNLFDSPGYDINRQKYSDAPKDFANNDRRYKEVEKVVMAYRQHAVQKLLDEDHGLRSQVEENRRNKLKALAGKLGG